MRRLLLLMAACGSGSSPERTPPPEPAPLPSKKPLDPITGAHGGPITAIAATSDGRAAVTADVTGGMRLWPTLDGTREPIVIKAATPTALAIAHDASGFAIAVTDSANQVELVRLDNKGNVRSRRKFGEAVQLEIVGDNVLVLRPDQVIEHIAVDGTVHGRLPAEQGTQIKSLLVHDIAAKAIIASEKGTNVVAIDLGKMLWSDKSPLLPIAEDAPLALHDNTVFALSAKENRITRWDLGTGKAKSVCPQPTIAAPRIRRRFHGFDGFGVNFVEPQVLTVVGTKVACFVDNQFSWWDIEKGSTTTVTMGSALTGVFSVASDRIVFANEHQLVIQHVERSEFLGYGFRDLTHVRSVPTGLMIGKGDQEPVLLDDNFRERARFSLPKLRVDWTDLVPIDDRYILTSSTRPGTGEMWGNAYQIGIYDTVKQVMHQVLPHRARSGDLLYEPTTQLIAASDGDDTLLVRHDPTTHALGEEVELVLPQAPTRVALLDPKLAGGLIAIAIRAEGNGGLHVHEFHGSDVPPPQERDGKYVVRSMKPRKTYRVAGELRAVDRAGRLYVYNVMYGESIGVYAQGENLAQLRGAQNAKVRPSPDGKHVIAVEEAKLTLFALDGTSAWTTAAWGSSDVDWTPAGMLYARFPHALARIDLATGTLAERQCGWGFGISATPRDNSSTAPSVCDVAP